MDITFSDAAVRFLDHCRVAKTLSSHTLRAYDTDLAHARARLGSAVPVGEIDRDRLRRYIGGMLNDEGLKETSVKRRLATIKQLFKWLEVREKADARAAQSRCYGYFLRSTAACYMWGEGKDLARAQSQLQKAKIRFLEDGDQFGALTAQANMGAVAAESGDLELALELTKNAYRGLAVFGLHNVEEVGVNLGTALLLTGRVDAAAQHLRSLLPALADDFPKPGFPRWCCDFVTATAKSDIEIKAVRT
ncbi:site-specific integrase, partial [Magnetospirillum moscoviense]|uniref:site-specific integrase n=1 Tax=Magnetospirillum moscoviense TaxID=1437059 RepID=UPI00155FC260